MFATANVPLYDASWMDYAWEWLGLSYAFLFDAQLFKTLKNIRGLRLKIEGYARSIEKVTTKTHKTQKDIRAATIEQQAIIEHMHVQISNICTSERAKNKRKGVTKMTLPLNALIEMITPEDAERMARGDTLHMTLISLRKIVAYHVKLNTALKKTMENCSVTYSLVDFKHTFAEVAAIIEEVQEMGNLDSIVNDLIEGAQILQMDAQDVKAQYEIQENQIDEAVRCMDDEETGLNHTGFLKLIADEMHKEEIVERERVPV